MIWKYSLNNKDSFYFSNYCYILIILTPINIIILTTIAKAQNYRHDYYVNVTTNVNDGTCKTDGTVQMAVIQQKLLIATNKANTYSLTDSTNYNTATEDIAIYDYEKYKTKVLTGMELFVL